MDQLSRLPGPLHRPLLFKMTVGQIEIQKTESLDATTLAGQPSVTLVAVANAWTKDGQYSLLHDLDQNLKEHTVRVMGNRRPWEHERRLRRPECGHEPRAPLDISARRQQSR